ncbi:MAG: hypothetical protein AAF639_02675 [Chloroflexota bacterium]
MDYHTTPSTARYVTFTEQLKQSKTIPVGLWSVLLIGIFAWMPTMYPGYWQTTEGFVPIFNLHAQTPLARIATIPDVWQGMGNATFLLPKAFVMLGLTSVEAIRMMFAFCFIAGGVGMYMWVRTITSGYAAEDTEHHLSDRVAGLTGLIYMLLTPFLATVYVRGSLSDALILGLLPIVFAGIARYAAIRTPSSAAIIILGILWMWRTQAGLALLATMLLLAYTLWVERHWLTTLIVAVSGISGLVTLIPLGAIEALSNPSPSSSIRFEEHFVYFFQFFANGWVVAPSIAGWQDEYPFQLGMVIIAFGVIATWLFVQQTPKSAFTKHSRAFLFCLTIGIILCGLALSPSQWLWEMTNADRLLTYPWQIILLACPLLAMGAGSLSLFSPQLSKIPYWPVLILLTVFGSASYLTTEYTQVEPPTTPIALMGDNQIAWLDVDITKNPPTQDVGAGEVHVDLTWQVLNPLAFDYNIFLQAVSISDDQAPNVVAQIDIQPLGDERSATTWRQGEILRVIYRLDLVNVNPDEIDVDTLQYYFGYYDWRDGQRLPVRTFGQPDVQSNVDDKLIFSGED